MSDFDRTNTGALFPNLEKWTDESMRTLKDGANVNWPDGKGSVNVGGTEFWLSGWRKTVNATGKKFWSLSVKAKDAAKPKAAEQKQQEMQEGMADDDIPF
jgi:hypothetical protein